MAEGDEEVDLKLTELVEVMLTQRARVKKSKTKDF